MIRRQLLSSAAAALALPALSRANCSPGRGSADGAEPTLDPLRARLNRLAARAPSSHNVQPWIVRVTGPRELTVAVAPERRLPEVDPTAREPGAGSPRRALASFVTA
jgi:hypothetical protein